MKVDVKELKKALTWVDTNTNVDKISLYIGDNKLVITTMDKYQSQVEIILYEDSSMMAKIKRTEVL